MASHRTKDRRNPCEAVSWGACLAFQSHFRIIAGLGGEFAVERLSVVQVFYPTYRHHSPRNPVGIILGVCNI